MTTFWGAVIALGYFAVICLAVGLCRARSKPAPKPPRPTPPIHPTWADVHAKAAAIAQRNQETP